MLSSRVCGALFGLTTMSRQSLPRNCRNAINCYVTLIRPSTISLNNICCTIIGTQNTITSHSFLFKQYSAHIKKPAEFHLNTIKGKELLKDALEMHKEQLREKKDVFVKDMRETKIRVKERVMEKMEEIVERENVLTIPNLLCVSRAMLSPYLAYVIMQEEFTLAMGVLLFAGFTDLMDGYIARNWPSQASKMGSFLDPMADKLLVGALVISLGYSNLFPMWLCGMVLFRDVFLIGAGFIIRYISLPPPKTLSRYFDVTHATAQLEPTFISKVNTVVQLVALATSLGAPIWGYIDHTALHGLWYFTGLTTVAAAASYIISKDTYKIIKETRQFAGKKS